MPLLETDVLIAAIDPEDPNHDVARAVFEEGGAALSPYALVELDLLVRSDVIVVRDCAEFWRKVEELLRRLRVRVVGVRPLHFAKARELRRSYGLTYFDSLHAAVAMVEGLELVSFDLRAYGAVRGLRCRRPSRR